MKSLAGLRMMVTFWFIIVWWKLRQPLCLAKYDHDLEEALKKAAKEKVGKSEEKQKKKEHEIEGWDLLMAHYGQMSESLGPILERFKDRFMQNYFIRNFVISLYSIWTYESSFLSILMFVSATLMGNFWGIEWYTIHIFDIFTDVSELTNIFKAILNNIKKLTLLSFLAAVFILVFNVISLNTYTPVLFGEEDLPEEACEDVIGCVIALWTGGAIG